MGDFASESSPLIQTKLHCPALPVDRVPRPRLTGWEWVICSPNSIRFPMLRLSGSPTASEQRWTRLKQFSPISYWSIWCSPAGAKASDVDFMNT